MIRPDQTRSDDGERQIAAEGGREGRGGKKEKHLPLLGYCTFRCSASCITFFQLPSSRFRSISDSMRRVWLFLLVIANHGSRVRVTWRSRSQSVPGSSGNVNTAMYRSSAALPCAESTRPVMAAQRWRGSVRSERSRRTRDRSRTRARDKLSQTSRNPVPRGSIRIGADLHGRVKCDFDRRPIMYVYVTCDACVPPFRFIISCIVALLSKNAKIVR